MFRANYFAPLGPVPSFVYVSFLCPYLSCSIKKTQLIRYNIYQLEYIPFQLVPVSDCKLLKFEWSSFTFSTEQRQRTEKRDSSPYMVL